jgi:hypothetical protein
VVPELGTGEVLSNVGIVLESCLVVVMESVIGGKTDGTKELVESWKSIVDAIVLDIVEFEGG